MSEKKTGKDATRTASNISASTTNQAPPATGTVPALPAAAYGLPSLPSQKMPALPPMPLPNAAAAPAPDFNALKASLESLRKAVTKKYPFTIAISLIPGQAAPLFEEDEQLPKEIIDAKPLHLAIIIPEEQYKDIPKIKPEIIAMVKETKENLWVHLKTPVDLWNYGQDSKFEFVDAIAQGYPVHDKGFLGALRVSSIHKSLVLRKFDKYVASYVIGGSLVRGTAGKDSDVDVFVVVDDTDVKRMNRIELLEKLRGIIYDYIREATALAAVKNILSVQVWLLTDFWQRVKDAEPVAFTFIRDGIPLYDRGTFIPWKLLLKMGRIKPSPEAIDLYVKQGEQTEEIVKRRLLDAMVDIYYGIVTPTQAMMMLAGEAPPVPKTIAQDVKSVLVEREGVLSEKDLKTLEKAVHLFKQYEYGKLKEYSSSEVEKFMRECKQYNEMLKELRKKLEKKLHEKTAEEIYANVFTLLTTIFGKKTQEELVKEFEGQLVKKGKIEQRLAPVLRELAQTKSKIKSGKLSQKEVENVKKDAFDLIQALTEYAQRADFVSARKGTMQVMYGGGRKAELVLLGNDNFLVEGTSIKKFSEGKLVASKSEELDKAINDNKGKIHTHVSGEVFSALEKTLGRFEISF